MTTKTTAQSCVLSIVAQGFDETETISLISALRQAGLQVKSVGVTSGLVTSAHGIYLMPDLTFSDFGTLIKIGSVGMVILPEGKQCLSKLETDPRLHGFLYQVFAQGSYIVVGSEGRQFLTKISSGAPGLFRSNNDPASLLLLRGQGQSTESFARDLAHRMGQTL